MATWKSKLASRSATIAFAADWEGDESRVGEHFATRTALAIPNKTAIAGSVDVLPSMHEVGPKKYRPLERVGQKKRIDFGFE